MFRDMNYEWLIEESSDIIHYYSELTVPFRLDWRSCACPSARRAWRPFLWTPFWKINSRQLLDLRDLWKSISLFTWTRVIRQFSFRRRSITAKSILLLAYFLLKCTFLHLSIDILHKTVHLFYSVNRLRFPTEIVKAKKTRIRVESPKL